MAKAMAKGKSAARIGPMKGTKRRSVARTPQSRAFGMPMRYSPTPISAPKAVLTMRCINR
jgi:hypothetical protein